MPPRFPADGPDRVLVSGDGTAVTSLEARVRHGVVPDVILLRDDGWTLGVPAWLLSEALRMWDGQWVGYWERPSTEFHAIR